MKDYVHGILVIFGAGCGCSVVILGVAGILMLLAKAIILFWQLVF